MNFTNSDTAPEQPNEGDHWFDSSGGTLYIYLADKDTNQWVEIQKGVLGKWLVRKETEITIHTTSMKITEI